MMQSLWEAETNRPKFPAQTENMQTDVLIVGGGLTGILCAYFLEQMQLPYVLVEGGELCGHTTANTTAKVTVQHGLCYQGIIQKYGEPAAQAYYEANRLALEKYRQLSKQMPFDFTEKEATVYVQSHKDTAAIDREYAAYTALGISAEFATCRHLPFSPAGAVRVRNQAQMHPLKFCYEIAQNLHIFTHTFVKGFDGTCAFTNRGRIDAKRVIFATHFPFLDRRGLYFMKLYQQRSYVLALENAADVRGMYVDGKENGYSFRNAENLLLLGGGGHKTGRKGGGFAALEAFAREKYPQSKVRFRWAAQDCMSLDGIPYIGRYAKAWPNFYVATGFNKWGMTSAMAAAQILTDMLIGRNNVNAAVFSPQRTTYKPKLLVNGISAAGDLLTPLPRRCTHLGCALHYNKQEHSWDCPCHGSRFSENGEILENPATRARGKAKE